MSIIGKVIRIIGIYGKLRNHFIDSLLVPFATKGQIGIREARFLGEITRKLNTSRPIIEIGTLFGRSTRIIAENMRKKQELLTVDMFCWNPCGMTKEEHEYITKISLADTIEKLNVKIVVVDKKKFYEEYKGANPEMVFLDADHSYEATKEDIDWALSVGADVICGHDYSDNLPGVVKAVNESGGIEKLVDTLWVLNRNKFEAKIIEPESVTLQKKNL